MVLEQIEQENDIQKIPKEQYDILAQEIREFIIDNVSQTGGHLSSSLGVVELTMALHLCLHLPEDKILWDVGHQSYAHKILTGRKDQFKTLRQYHGISGFPCVQESKCDAFGMGHASTSLSAALGYAKARELEGKDNTIVAVIGDGALTGGMAYEALNNTDQIPGNLIIILNDNEMSISENVGGISKLLTSLRTGDHYNELKDNVKNRLSRIPGYGDELIGKIHKTKSSIKQFFVPGMMFEEMGVTYLGPADGHDIQKLMKMIRMAKRVNHAVLIHVHTKKGKGFSYAEKRPSFYHGVDAFDIKSGELLNKKQIRTYSDVFSAAITKMASEDEKIFAITAAMADGTGLKRFEKLYPKRFADVGIAEEHAVTFAAGLAMEGFKPYVAIYSTFMQRGFDQIIHDVCIQNLPVKFIVERAGIVGNDGVTHQGIFDLSYFNLMPNMTIMAPKNRFELRDMLQFSAEYNAPLMIRFPRGAALDIYDDCRAPIVYGKSEILQKGSRVALYAAGSMVKLAEPVAERLALQGIEATVINARFVKPIDEALLSDLQENHELIVTMEENVITGGFGQSVLHYVNEQNLKISVLNIALPDRFIPHGSVSKLWEEYGFDAETIFGRILQKLGELK